MFSSDPPESVGELAKHLGEPTEYDLRALLRVGSYVAGTIIRFWTPEHPTKTERGGNARGVATRDSSIGGGAGDSTAGTTKHR